MLTGIWCTKAPFGYDNARRNGDLFIKLNDKGKILRKAFLWKVNENMCNTEIVARLMHIGKGFKLEPTTKRFKGNRRLLRIRRDKSLSL